VKDFKSHREEGDKQLTFGRIEEGKTVTSAANVKQKR